MKHSFRILASSPSDTILCVRRGGFDFVAKEKIPNNEWSGIPLYQFDRSRFLRYGKRFPLLRFKRMVPFGKGVPVQFVKCSDLYSS